MVMEVFGVMTTDGGPHTTDRWAYVTAKKIVDTFVVVPTSPQKVELEVAKDAARAEIYKIMERHHKAVQSKEREALKQGDHARLITKLQPKEHTDIEEAIEEIVQALQPVLKRCNFVEQVQTADTPFPAKNRAETNQDIYDMVAASVFCDMNTVMDIERSWHADKNPENKHSVEYRRLKTGA
jgi:hypothetical protein